MIVGIGVDVVNVARFGATLRRTPGVRERLFTVAERTVSEACSAPTRPWPRRFAAKEAVAKALGAPQGLRWHDCEVVSDPDGRPWLRTSGTVAEAAAALGVAALAPVPVATTATWRWPTSSPRGPRGGTP